VSAASVNEVIRHYQAKGLRGVKLREAIRRHVRLLSVLDLDVALELCGAKLGGK
jgi:hypothetical protein